MLALMTFNYDIKRDRVDLDKKLKGNFNFYFYAVSLSKSAGNSISIREK